MTLRGKRANLPKNYSMRIPGTLYMKVVNQMPSKVDGLICPRIHKKFRKKDGKPVNLAGLRPYWFFILLPPGSGDFHSSYPDQNSKNQVSPCTDTGKISP